MRKLVSLLWVWVAVMIVTTFTISIQAHPPPKSYLTLDTRADHRLMKVKNGLRRLLWLWEDNYGVTKEPGTTTTRTPTSHTGHTTPVSSISTKKPSRWRSWFSSVGTKISNAAQKAKDELTEAKRSYSVRMATVGRAIMAGGNATKEGILGAGRAIKKGAKRIGAAIKTGLRKVRLKFAGTGEKFRIVANRLKEKLEAGDKRALALMEKLGINVVFLGNRITGSSVENNSLPVSEILKNEGHFSNKSALHNTSGESINADLSLRTDEEHPSRFEDRGINVINLDEDLYPVPDVNGSVESAMVTTRSSTMFEVIGEPTVDTNQPIVDTKQPVMTTTIFVPATITQPSTDDTHPVTTTFHSASSTHLSKSTPLLPTFPSTTITHPSTITVRSARTTHLSSITRLAPTNPSSTTITNPSTTTILPESTIQLSTTTRLLTTVPPITTETQKTTTEPLKTSTLTPTTTTETSLTTTQLSKTTTTVQPTYTRTSSPATTTLLAVTTRSTRTPGTDSTPDQPHVSLPEEPDRTEEEPYEPPPFPDVFNEIEVHDRLKDFYDNGGFSHAELTEIFNFDPDNYEYYYDY